jgi:hypothetical protein
MHFGIIILPILLNYILMCIKQCYLFQRYALTLAEQLGLKGAKSAKPLGKTFNEEHLDHFREDQIAQLYELKLASTGKDNELDANQSQEGTSLDHKKSQEKT